MDKLVLSSFSSIKKPAGVGLAAAMLLCLGAMVFRSYALDRPGAVCPFCIHTNTPASGMGKDQPSPGQGPGVQPALLAASPLLLAPHLLYGRENRVNHRGRPSETAIEHAAPVRGPPARFEAGLVCDRLLTLLIHQGGLK